MKNRWFWYTFLFLFATTGYAAAANGPASKIIFGSYCGECQENCAIAYQITQDSLWVDWSDRLLKKNPYVFSGRPLPSSLQKKVVGILNEIPERLWQETNDILGDPDAYDQCGYFLRVWRDGKGRTWHIDPESETAWVKKLNRTLSSYLKLVSSEGPPRPTKRNWYAYQVTFDPASIPAGVTLSQKDSNMHGIDIAITYQGKTPLILSKRAEPPLDWTHVLPKNCLPLMKLVDGGCYNLDLVLGHGWRPCNHAPIVEDLLNADPSLQDKDIIERQELINGPSESRPPKTLPPLPNREILIPLFVNGKDVAAKGYLEYRREKTFESSFWYEAVLHLENPTLVPGLKLKSVMHLFDPVTNPSKTPVYLVQTRKKDLAWIGILPLDRIPLLLCKEGRSLHRTEEEQHNQSDGWMPNSNSCELPFDQVAQENGFKILELQAIDKPANAKLPANRSFAFPIYLGSKEHVIKGQLTYQFIE